MPEADLQDKVVVVTGASSGIGAALAEGFVIQGAKVALIAQRVDRLESLTRRLGSEHSLSIPTNVTNYLAVTRAHEIIAQRWGQIHVLVNNAGVRRPDAPIWETEPEDWGYTFDVNINGVFHCIRAFLPEMLRNGYGRIINIGSWVVNEPLGAAYSLTKNCVDVLTSILAAELVQKGSDVIVSSLDPCETRTEMNLEEIRDPRAVVPKVLYLATLPKGAPSGRKWHL